LESVTLLGVKVSRITVNALIDFIIGTVEKRGKARVAYVNVHAINLAQDHPWLMNFLNESAIVYCDGFGVKWGARLLGLKIPERLSPPDWIRLLAAECARQKSSLFLLGARPGVVEKLGTMLGEQFPGLVIAGSQHGHFDHSNESQENVAILETINESHPDILLVGMGMPLQERWIMENWDSLETKVIIPVGAMFDYLTGEFWRAPRWMTDHGLEWLGRLFVEPRRLWRRYLFGNPRFLFLVLREKLRLMRGR
jgi:N-acetylglucosaminyldiphosphoundecaprenol N-acetyl-beta-D-mannosaminyltransferase